MTLAQVVYLLGALTSCLCAVLLMRGYVRGKRALLLWSSLCFSGLTVANALVFIDLVLLPQVDLFRYRLTATAISLVLLLYGLIWESE